MKKINNRKKITLVFLIFFGLIFLNSNAQEVRSDGCVVAGFGIDAGLYPGVVEYGAGVEPASPRSRDWFKGSAGLAIIREDSLAAIKSLLQSGGNPTYEERMDGDKVSINGGQIWIDAIFARDQFGGTGFQDATTFLTASKNGEDPAIWDPGEMNVLGKNDIIDAGGHMFRDGTGVTSNLWFVGLFNMAEPGGTAYMDFEFYVDNVQYSPGSGFTSGGPQLGHTAYNFDGPGNITKIGDFIFSVALSGQTTAVETRLWVSRADWVRLGGATMVSTPTFQWAGTFDGAFNGSPYGYAGIIPLVSTPVQICGYVNNDIQTPLAPPWGTKGTKTNSWRTNYIPNSLAEVGINLTAMGMDHASLSGADPCYFPLNTFIVKTRASASFTAQLKDFSGPYSWGQPTVSAVTNQTNISCDNKTATVTAVPLRDDVTYFWETVDGNIISGQGTGEITVDQPGTYKLTITLPTNCPVQTAEAVVGYDTAYPFFDGPPAYSYTVPCNGNGNDGTLTVTASGATKPYTFYLYTYLTNTLITQVTKLVTESSHTFTGLTPGTYRVDVKGVHACIESTGPVIIPARIPVVINETLTPVACFGENTGAINLAVSGGNPPLAYLWSTGNTSQNLLNIGAGTYAVSVTDKDGCVTTDSYEVTQPTQITATIAKTDDPGNAGNGAATVTTSDGTPGYTYLWSKTGDPAFVFQPNATGVQVTNLSYGEYTVKVTDANGCYKNITVFIYQKEICNDSIDNDGDGLNNCDDSDCIPVVPSTITSSNAIPCLGEAETYTVLENITYVSYEWTVPSNATINSGQGTKSISVTWTSTSGGQICVQGKIYDCLSASVCINVIVDDVPSQPGDIILNNN